MKKELSFYQFITIAITLLTLIVGGWINFTIKVADLNARVINLEQTQVKLDNTQNAKVDKTTFMDMTKDMNHRLEVIQSGQQKIYELLIDIKK